MSAKTFLKPTLNPDDFNDALPDEWTNWPTRVELAYTLTMGGGVTGEDYVKFRVESLYEAAQFLFDPIHQRRYFRYSLKADQFLPAYRYDAQWSLLRRGATGGVWRRQPEQRTEPWSFGADTTLLEIWRQPITTYTFQSRFWLRTGGRTREKATLHWIASAKLLRRAYRLWYADCTPSAPMGQI